MFDITSSKLLILAIVALIVVGPKDLPILLRTVGKYLGVIRRHANEFRAQFDEALREAELDQLRKDFDAVRNEVRSTIEQGSRAVETGIEKAGTHAEPPRKEADAPPAAAEPVVSAQATVSAAPAAPQPDTQPATQADKTGT